LIVFLSFMMVSGVRYDTFPKFTFKESARNKAKLLFLIGSMVLIAVFPMVSFFALIMFVILQGVVRSVIHTLKKTPLEESKVKL